MALCLPLLGPPREGGRAVWVPGAGLSRTEQEGKQPARLGGGGQAAFGNCRAAGGKGTSKSLPSPASLKDNRSLERWLLCFCFHGSTSLRAATPSVSTSCPGAARPVLLESPTCGQLAKPPAGPEHQSPVQSWHCQGWQ